MKTTEKAEKVKKAEVKDRGEVVVCPDCFGAGYMGGDDTIKCPLCRGTGIVPKN